MSAGADAGARSSSSTPRSSLQLAAFLDEQLLAAEAFKCLVLAAIFGIGVVVTAVVFGGAELRGEIPEFEQWFLLPVVMASASAYQLISRRQLLRAIAARTRVHWSSRYINGFLEVSIPTVLLLVRFGETSAAAVLSSPPAFAYAVLIFIGALRLDYRLCLFTGAVAADQYAALVLCFDPSEVAAYAGTPLGERVFYMVRVGILIMTGIVTAIIAYELRRRLTRSFELAEERNWVVGVFGRYLTDEVVDVLLNSPEGLSLGGEKREVTMMMTDLRGFSSLSEEHPAEAVVAMINNFLDAMTEVIVDHGGTIDEFIGDAIFVLFGAPVGRDDDPDRAIACALAMQQRMKQVNAWNRAQGFPDLAMGVGVHTGSVVVGNIGSERRSKYGAVGSAVNMTARIESLTVGGQILCSAATRAAVTAELRVRDTIQFEPKGARGPITVHDVRGIGAPYGLELEDRREALVHLQEPIPVQVRVLRGKTGVAAPRPGQITALTMETALLAMHAKGDVLGPLTNLRIALLGGDEPGAATLVDDLFAKVHAFSASSDAVAIVFTSKSQAAAEVLAARLATAADGRDSVSG